MKIYVASSWRNNHQQQVVSVLRAAGHAVYDFRHPNGTGTGGFSWREVDPNWKDWTPQQYREGLKHPIAQSGFKSDFDAMKECDMCVLVMPAGRSASLEAGWCAGACKPTVMYVPEQIEPELMALLLGVMEPGHLCVVTTLEELIEAVDYDDSPRDSS